MAYEPKRQEEADEQPIEEATVTEVETEEG
jgi:hypothetical protein